MQVMRVKEVAAKLGVHPNTIYVWIKTDGFPRSFLVGGVSVWDVADIDKWLEHKKEMQHGSRRTTEAEAV